MRKILIPAAVALGGLLVLAAAPIASAAPGGSAAPGISANSPSPSIENVQYWGNRPYYWNHRHWRYRHWNRGYYPHRWRYYN
jgi:hypothetical protein